MSSPARLVLDTNVLLDCCVFRDPVVAPILGAIERGDAVAFTRTDCIEELRRVLDYPKLKLDPDHQATIYRRAAALVQMCDLPAGVLRLPRCADPDDQKFLELARDVAADYLVSKDKRVLVLGRHRAAPLPFRIVDPAGLARAWAITPTARQ